MLYHQTGDKRAEEPTPHLTMSLSHRTGDLQAPRVGCLEVQVPPTSTFYQWCRVYGLRVQSLRRVGRHLRGQRICFQHPGHDALLDGRIPCCAYDTRRPYHYSSSKSDQGDIECRFISRNAEKLAMKEPGRYKVLVRADT